MALASLSLRGFRNLEPTNLELSQGTNYLFGPNGAGKTNLLEAVHYLALGKSFRRCPDADLLGFDREVLAVSGKDDEGTSAEIRFDGREKRVLLNDTRVAKLSAYFAWLPVVVLLLEDTELVRGAPEARRAFIDLAMAKADGLGAERSGLVVAKPETKCGAPPGEPSYIALAARYRRAVSQYNRLLELGARGEGRETGQELAAWEEELARAGAPLYQARMRRLPGLLEQAARHYLQLTGCQAEFRYRPSVGESSELADAFRQSLAATRARALYLGHAVVGPHRDDISITLQDRSLRRFGSVGEQRMAGIALRLAEADMILESRRQRPVFLLDEVASELDEQRNRLALALVAERGQMVYAAARRMPGSGVRGFRGSGEDAVRDRPASRNPQTLAPQTPFLRKEFHVEAGKISELP